MLSLTYFLEYCLTFTNIISGALIFTLEKSWFSTLEDSHKIPLYALVSTSLAFAIVYIFIDVIEVFIEAVHFDCCKKPSSAYRPLVISNLQHLELLIATLTVGFILGLIYSLNDVEQYWQHLWQMIYAAKWVEKRYFAPVGTLMGSIGGLVFMAIRTKELKNIESQKIEKGNSKKFQHSDGDLGVLKFDKEDYEGIQTDSSDDEESLLM